MGKVFAGLNDDLRTLIGRQHIFFVATAEDGLLPAGADCRLVRL
jgi:hypothetical protein